MNKEELKELKDEMDAAACAAAAIASNNGSHTDWCHTVQSDFMIANAYYLKAKNEYYRALKDL